MKGINDELARVLRMAHYYVSYVAYNGNTM